jgi:hypothetical protein
MVNRRDYVVEVPWEGKQLDATIFEYGVEDVIDIKVGRILWNSKKQGDLNDPLNRQLGESTSYKIHAGYRHVLIGFNREIAFVTEDHLEDQECRFRCQYLMRVLDAFVEELRGRTMENPANF